MKFNAPIGLGEIVAIKGIHDVGAHRPDLAAKKRTDALGKVTAVIFAIGQNPVYFVRYRNAAGQDVQAQITADELEGDIDFDQEAGQYPDDLGELYDQGKAPNQLAFMDAMGELTTPETVLLMDSADVDCPLPHTQAELHQEGSEPVEPDDDGRE